ncbi:hypothetical protein AVV29_gp054 [Vibrio phage phi 3]|uniref:Uncharacterized protein n=1 Tax=Vibrio phage phi 3 TaxID=1589298 RepID=A0A0B5H2V7_9CAUD|nr:hypothetical protein AVV29_gp054 [Vibrio phage phi 3]AJF40822.1 hypothetical protein SBVP3_0054 [Vibrio phage phi 3]
MDISYYGMALDAALSANNELKRRANVEEWFYNAGVVEYCKQFNTIHLDFGRQTGKTTFAASLVSADPDNRLIIPHSYQMVEHIIKQYELPAKSVSTCDNKVRLSGLGTRPLSLVIIDEPGFLSSKDIDSVYEMLGSPYTYFLLLGRGRK